MLTYDRPEHDLAYAYYIINKVWKVQTSVFWESVDAVADRWKTSDENIGLLEYIGKYGIDCPDIVSREAFFDGPYHDPEVCDSCFIGSIVDFWLEEHGWSEKDLYEHHVNKHHK